MRNLMITRVRSVVCGFAVIFCCFVSCAHAAFHCVEPSNIQSSSKCYQDVNSALNSSRCQHGHYTCQSHEKAIAWKEINSSSGLFEFSFLLTSPGCNHTNYSLTLELFPGVSKNECRRNHLPSNGAKKPHSKREYEVKQADAPCTTTNCSVCGKTGSVRFQFVFSGCYQLKIEPEGLAAQKRPITSCPMFLESSYQKEFITDHKPTFWQDSGDQNSPVQLGIRFEPLACSRMRLEIKLMKDKDNLESNCYQDTKEHSKCTIEVDESKCEAPNAVCHTDGSLVSCKFEPIHQGKYCAIMKITDDEDRCKPGMLWTLAENGAAKPCNWHQEFTRGGAARSDQKEEDASQTYALFGGIMVITLVVALIGVWFKVKHMTSRRLEQDGEIGSVGSVGVGGVGGVGSVVGMDGGASSPLRPRCGVLLLYARDCEPFMQLMQTFRRLLEDAVKLEVYDCFDERRWEQVSRSPTEWMRRLALHPEVKVIAVASSCASLRLESHLTNTRLQYAQPTSMDDLFVYALQLLGDNVHRDNGYQKLFIVRFAGFSDDLDLFTHLNSYTRYVLPAHYDLLVASLHQNLHDQSLPLLEQNQVQTIRRDLKNLVRYKSEHENYLEDYLLIRKCS